MNEILLKRKELEIEFLKWELKGLKRRVKLIEKLGFSELVPPEYLSLNLEQLDSEITMLLLDGKINPYQYSSYLTKRNGFHLPSFSEFVLGY
jgi:hypothetical protein